MQIDGLELIRKMQNNEIEENTKIKVYRIDDKFNSLIHEIAELTYFQNQTLWTENSFRLSMLYDKKHVFEIIEEEKEIEELPMERGDINDKVFLAKYITHNRYKINELVREVNKLKKEGK